MILLMTFPDSRPRRLYNVWGWPPCSGAEILRELDSNEPAHPEPTHPSAEHVAALADLPSALRRRAGVLEQLDDKQAWAVDTEPC